VFIFIGINFVPVCSIPYIYTVLCCHSQQQ